MSRTQGRLDSDQAYKDGLIFFPIKVGDFTTGTPVITRPGAGQVGVSLTGSATAYVAMMSLPFLMLRTGVQDDLQEYFGSLNAGGANAGPVPGLLQYSVGSLTAGNSVTIQVANSAGFTAGNYLTVDTVASGVQEFPQITSITDATHIVVNALAHAHSAGIPITQNVFTTPAGVTGRPPFTGTTEFTPVTAPRPKGIKIKQLAGVYSVSTAAGTLNQLTLTATQYIPNNTAIAQTTLLAATGMPETTNAQPFVSPVTLPVANQNFIVTPYTQLVLEWDFTTGTGGSAVLYGVYAKVDYNFN
jgi:hypothetical protein